MFFYLRDLGFAFRTVLNLDLRMHTSFFFIMSSLCVSCTVAKVKWDQQLGQQRHVHCGW